MSPQVVAGREPPTCFGLSVGLRRSFDAAVLGGPMGHAASSESELVQGRNSIVTYRMDGAALGHRAPDPNRYAYLRRSAVGWRAASRAPSRGAPVSSEGGALARRGRCKAAAPCD